jgi:hypothetical protein
VPETAADALGMLDAALDYLNSADVQALGIQGQREADAILITAAVHGCGEHELSVIVPLPSLPGDKRRVAT